MAVLLRIEFAPLFMGSAAQTFQRALARDPSNRSQIARFDCISADELTERGG
jgi:hypothetical protein